MLAAASEPEANGGLLPEQWNHHPLQLKPREGPTGSKTRVRSAPGALDTLVQHVEPMGMVSAELALPLTCRQPGCVGSGSTARG